MCRDSWGLLLNRGIVQVCYASGQHPSDPSVSCRRAGFTDAASLAGATVVVMGQTEATEGGVGAAVVVRRGDVVTDHLSQAVVWNRGVKSANSRTRTTPVLYLFALCNTTCTSQLVPQISSTRRAHKMQQATQAEATYTPLVNVHSTVKHRWAKLSRAVGDQARPIAWWRCNNFLFFPVFVMEVPRCWSKGIDIAIYVACRAVRRSISGLRN
jgi:hypothetical protein